MAKRRNWERHDIQRALALYLITPFGRIHSGNPDIIKLAIIINRTPSAVALKMSNLVAVDDSINRKGMANASKLDRQVWHEYLIDPTGVLNASEIPKVELEYQQTPDNNFAGFGEGRDIIVSATNRRGQELFRKSVLTSYESQCGLTKINDPRLLVASHIIGWAESSGTRMNPSNGICLNPLHDKAFDKHLISFGLDFELLVAKNIPKDNRDALNDVASNRPRLPNRFLPSQEFLAHHRQRFLELQG